MANNTVINPGTGGDTIRDIDRSGIKTQIVGLDINPQGPESLMAAGWQMSQYSLPVVIAQDQMPIRCPFSNILSVADSDISVLLLPINGERRGATIYNDSTAKLYLRFSPGDASTTEFSVKLFPDDFYEMGNLVYFGDINGIWEFTSGGAARITEFVW